MERVTFLIEETGDQLACLLNPESLVVRRKAGVRARESASGQLTEAGLTDRPLLFTGGGTTEIELDLLFDVALAGSSITSRNVQNLTGRLWNLAENSEETHYGRPPLVRLIWGKTFNLPGIVAGVAERLERFTGEGIPTRSWMRMRVVRIDEKALERSRPAPSPPPDALMDTAAEAPPGGGTHTVSGGMQEPPPGEAEAGVATASGIVASAFSASGAAAMLATAQAAVSAAAGHLSGGADRISESDEEDPSAGEQLRAAAETFGRAMASAADGVRSGNLSAVGAAVEQMFAASSSAAAAAASLASDAGRAVAGEITGALDTVGPAAEKLLTAARAVVREVVQTSARVIAAAVARTDQVVDRISATAEHLASAATEGARKAGALLQSGLEQVGDALDRIRTSGAFAAAERLSGAFQQLSETVDRLWSAGLAAAADGISTAIEEMAIRLKNMKAAGEAIRSVMTQAVSGLLRGMSKTLESTVAAVRESGDLSRLAPLTTYLQAIKRSVLSAGPEAQRDAREQAREAAHTVESTLQEVLDSGETARLDEVTDHLPALADAAQALQEAEQEETSEAIVAAVRVRDELPPGEPAAQGEEAVAPRHQSERLDQIAFRSYGSPAYWRLLALHNDIEHPLRLPSGLQLKIPPAARPSGS